MESDAELRAELRAAIAKVSRQIEIQAGSVNFLASGPSSGPALVEALKAELSQLEEALAGLEPGAQPAEPAPPTPLDSDLSAPADTNRRGVLIALKARSIEPVVVGRFLLFVGSLGVAGAAAAALAHFGFGMPVYEGRQAQRLMRDPEVLEVLAAFACAFGVAAALGLVALRDARRRDATNDLVR